MKKTNYKWSLSKEEDNKKDKEYILESSKTILIGFLVLLILFELIKIIL
jgi:hypothetical protein